MPRDLSTAIGAVRLNNPDIAGPAGHMIDPNGILRALDSGVGAVVVKSNNEAEGAKDQLERSEYMFVDDHWRKIPWDGRARRNGSPNKLPLSGRR